MGTQKHRLFLVIRLLVAFIVIFFILKLVLPSKEYTAIQSIIANISNYQSEIESQGYQVSVFDPISGNISKEDDFALIHYSGEIYEPVLILTDQAGGRWYFHNGFDQYAQQTESIEQTPIIGGEEVLKIVTQLQLYKAHINRPPLKENKFKPDKMSYYDVVVEMDFEGYLLEIGEYVYIRNSGPCQLPTI